MADVNQGLAKMLCSGVIMDVSSVQEARTAEAAGAVAVMALDNIPSEMRASGKVCRMATLTLIREIKAAVSIPVMAKCRIGHTVEARVLQEAGVDFIDESEVLTAADDDHINKKEFTTPFVCGARNLGEALRRVQEGATMIRTKGEAGTGDVRHAVSNFRNIHTEIMQLQRDAMLENGEWSAEVIQNFCKLQDIRNSVLVRDTLSQGRLPVVTFAAGGIATPADAALMMSLGSDGVFVGSGIFAKGVNHHSMAGAMCQATSHHADIDKVLQACTSAGKPMVGSLVTS